jgi:hypothetical protein
MTFLIPPGIDASLFFFHLLFTYFVLAPIKFLIVIFINSSPLNDSSNTQLVSNVHFFFCSGFPATGLTDLYSE